MSRSRAHGRRPVRSSPSRATGARDCGRCVISRGAGHPAHFLARALEDDAPGADAWRRRYGRLRIRATERAAHAPVIYTGGATDKIAAAWERGGSIVALCDVPLPPGRSKIAVPFRGRTLLMPRGLIAQACARGIPVVTFAAGPDRATGRRWLGIAPAKVYSDPMEMAAALARASSASSSATRRHGTCGRTRISCHLIRVAAVLADESCSTRDQSTCATTITRLPLASCS